MFVVRVLAVVPILATLAACAPSSVVSNRSDLMGVEPRTTVERTKKVAVTKRYAPRGSEMHTARPGSSAYGVASFYSEGSRTADGEKFNPRELTAAHPTLPFGTRLRVTNLSNGRSVIVRVNDRGPFVHGRMVDVSYSAAESLKMIGSGTAKVKVDVVQ